MPGPGPLDVFQDSALLRDSERILARMSPLVPGPDAVARGHVLSGADWTDSIAARPLDIAPPACRDVIFTLQNLSDRVTSSPQQ